MDPVWERLGLHPMRSDVSSSAGLAMPRSSGTPLWVAERYSTDVCSTRLRRDSVDGHGFQFQWTRSHRHGIWDFRGFRRLRFQHECQRRATTAETANAVVIKSPERLKAL